VRDLVYGLRTWMLTGAQRALARPGPIEHGGLSLVVAPGVHHPAPALGIGFWPLQEAALERIPPRAAVLEIGTGAGFWAIAAARRGFEVTATDLPHVPLEPVADAAVRAGVSVRLLHSDLFDALDETQGLSRDRRPLGAPSGAVRCSLDTADGKHRLDRTAAQPTHRYDAILFNPPFHDAAPRDLAETAWCGGDVIRRCLARAPEHLTPNGALHLLMPRIDRRRYTVELARWSAEVAASRWYPLLGRTDLLVLRPR